MKPSHYPENVQRPGWREEIRDLGNAALVGVGVVTIAIGYQFGVKPIEQYAHDHPVENPHGIEDRRQQVENEQRRQAEIGSAPQLVAPTANQAPQLSQPTVAEQTIVVAAPNKEA